MKHYQVFTTEAAENELTTLWLNAETLERKQITQSSHFLPFHRSVFEPGC